MAKKATKDTNHESNGEDNTTERTRARVDYSFEEHNDGEPIKDLGLTLNTPSAAATVQKWIERHADELGITGKIRVCKKVYS